MKIDNTIERDPQYPRRRLEDAPVMGHIDLLFRKGPDMQIPEWGSGLGASDSGSGEQMARPVFETAYNLPSRVGPMLQWSVGHALPAWGWMHSLMAQHLQAAGTTAIGSDLHAGPVHFGGRPDLQFSPATALLAGGSPESANHMVHVPGVRRELA